MLESDRHAELAAELREAGTLALERRYRAFDGETLQGLSGAPSAISVKNGSLRIEAERPVPAFLLIDRDLAPLFRLEADVTLEDGYTLFGLAYESPESRGRTGFVMCPETTDNKAPASPAYAPFDQIGRGRVADLVEEYVPSRMSTGLWIDPKVRRMKPPIPAGEEIKVVLSRTEADELVLEVNGEVVRSTYVEETGSTSTLSLMVYGGIVDVTRLEVFELDRM